MRELDGAVAVMRAVADAVGPHTAVIAAAVRGRRRARSAGARSGGLPALVERTGIAGALVDTFVKDGRGLYGWLTGGRAGRPDRAHARGRADFAVAGQLRLGELRRVAADVVGVRSAVCRGGDRTAELDADWSQQRSPSSGPWR